MSEAAIRAALVNVGTAKRWAKTYGSWSFMKQDCKEYYQA
jgi:hypothetical protein